MRVLLLGATGRTGAHVLEYLLADGQEGHALVRDRKKLGRPRDRLRIFEGAPTDVAALEGRDIRVSRDNSPPPRLTIGRRSVARFLIRILADGAYSRQAVTISAE